MKKVINVLFDIYKYTAIILLTLYIYYICVTLGLNIAYKQKFTLANVNNVAIGTTIYMSTAIPVAVMSEEKIIDIIKKDLEAEEYEISFTNIEGTVSGYCNLETKKIFIDKDLLKTQLAKTYLHEVMHLKHNSSNEKETEYRVYTYAKQNRYKNIIYMNIYSSMLVLNSVGSPLNEYDISEMI